MSTIIAGVFKTMGDAEKTAAALKDAGIAKDDVSLFVLNAPGQHDLYPIGGDEAADPGAREAHNGAVAGAAIGASAALGAGVAAMAATGAGPAIAVAAAAVGAYTGSLVGALNSLGDEPHEAAPATPDNERHAGVMVAVNIPQEITEASTIALLQEGGAQQIEKANGEWRNGEWVDFDPEVHPR